MILNYLKFMESYKDVFTDHKSTVKMSEPDYLALLDSETMNEKDFDKLCNKLRIVSKIIGFQFDFQKEKINNTKYYKISIDFDLLSVKGSFLDIITRTTPFFEILNPKLNNNVYFSYNDNTALKRKSITIGSKLLGLSSTSDASVISSNSNTTAYKEIMNIILQKMISCHGEKEFITSPSNIEFDIPELKIHLLSLIGSNMSLSKKPTINNICKKLLNNLISHHKNSYNLIEYMKKENPELYKLYTTGYKSEYKKGSDMHDMGFGD